MKVVKGLVCGRCGTEVCVETDKYLKKEYPYYCPCCDENMFSFECACVDIYADDAENG